MLSLLRLFSLPAPALQSIPHLPLGTAMLMLLRLPIFRLSDLGLCPRCR